MPTYSFRNKNTNEEFNETMSISSMEKYLKDNPHIIPLIVSATPIADPMRLGLKKPDQGFRDVLREIQKKHPGSNGLRPHI